MMPFSTDDRHNQSHDQLLQLAYQGDATAIATLMNRHLSRQQITAQVEWEGNRLHICLEAVRPPAPEPLTTVIHRTILKLKVPTLKTLKISCQQADTRELVWSQEQAIAPRSTANTVNPAHTALSKQDADRASQSLAAPITLQDWLSQTAKPSLAELMQPLSATNESEADLRFLRFSFSASETALLSLASIRQVMKVQPQSLLTVPDMPAFVIGICHFHGEMLWLVDLGLQLGFQGVTVGRSHLHAPSATAPQGHWMAIVIQAQSKSLGLIVPQVIDIERHAPTQLQPPTKDLFPATLLPFIQGYLVRSSSPVLDANALLADRRLQVHAA
ncbi:MAG: chemotaxis protein CheW [Stenomitos rutilans HA7619-LM2]|jgi:positive phototaxis protein PixI|nr:chemotaxis protein CheW [Stenomitos rutilans HA7619-LM2]